MTYLVSMKDPRGDTVDQAWFHSRGEARHWVKDHYPGRVFTEFMAATAGENDALSWGEWPGGSETDYDMMCAGCDGLLWRGLIQEDEA